jgi:HlyD family type I secretion membrane fusion protein
MKLDLTSLGIGGGGSAGPGNGRTAAAVRTVEGLLYPAKRQRLDDASRVVRVGLIAAAGFFGLLLLFSLLVPISGAASAAGEVTTSGSRVLIQPSASGVVAELLVTEGQFVRAGQPLLRLNGVRSGAAAEQAQARRDGLRALQARLTAERDELDAIAFPTDLTQRANQPHVAGLLQAQNAIFARHQELLAAERTSAATRSDGAEAQRTGAAQQLALINEELTGIRKLYRRGYARKTQVLALERAAAELQAQQGSGAAGVAEAQLDIARVRSRQAMDVVSQLAQVDAQLAQVDPALRVTRYDAERDLLRAPVDGQVSGVTRLGAGTVVSAGTTVMEVVPSGRALIVEALIPPADIDDVRLGSAATLRFTTINPRAHGAYEGEVIALSPARVPGASEGTSGFRVQVRVADPTALERDGVRLQPGIPVTVQVRTHDRTLFNYLFAPVGDAMSGAFREE